MTADRASAAAAGAAASWLRAQDSVQTGSLQVQARGKVLRRLGRTELEVYGQPSSTPRAVLALTVGGGDVYGEGVGRQCLQ